MGNHENFEWPLYKRLIQQRIGRSNDLSCSGDIGVKALCRYKNIEIVQVSPGIDEVEGVDGQANYADFISTAFADSDAQWRICAWHKNQNKMQTGKKNDATGWDVYDACLDAGAMVALAHEHAYSRTYLLSDFRNQTIVHKNSEMTLEPGRSFGFVSGLGGYEVREQVQGGDWWASIYTASQGATHGALFCTFEETTADCYFKAIDGAMPDQFSLKTRLGSISDPVITAPVPVLESLEHETVTPDPNVEPDEIVVADHEIPEAEEPAAVLLAADGQSSVTEPDVVEQLMAETVVESDIEIPTSTPVAPSTSTESESGVQSEPEPVSIAIDTDVSGPLTIVSGREAAADDSEPSTIDSETDEAAGQDERSGSASGVVSTGSVSLFVFLLLMARIRVSPGFFGNTDRPNRVC